MFDIRKICCRFSWHRFDGCRCLDCGLVRDQEHEYVTCRCKKCNAQRDHGHAWDGCKCKTCGMQRDEEHQWDRCKCQTCGARREQEHIWNGCVCQTCSKWRDQEHEFVKCKCIRCRKSGEHQWAGCACAICGEKGGYHPDLVHDWNGLSRCKKCNFRNWIFTCAALASDKSWDRHEIADGMSEYNDTKAIAEAEDHPELIPALYTGLKNGGGEKLLEYLHALARNKQAVEQNQTAMFDALSEAEKVQKAGGDPRPIIETFYRNLPKGGVCLAAAQLLKKVNEGEFGSTPQTDLETVLRKKAMILGAYQTAYSNLTRK